MGFYSDLAATADQLLGEFGADATLKSRTVGAYDAATAAATVTETSNTVKCAVFDFADRHIDGTLVLSGDKDCYIRTKGKVAPRTGDVLVWGGVEYEIVRFKPLAPALIAVLWQVQLRFGGA
jgi:hypothetical protein